MAAGAIRMRGCSPGDTHPIGPASFLLRDDGNGFCHPLVTRHESTACDRFAERLPRLGRATPISVQERSEHDHKRSQRRAGRHPAYCNRRTGPSGRTRFVGAATGGLPDLLSGDRGADGARPGREARRLQAGHHPGARSSVGVRPGAPQDRSAGSAQRAGAADRHRHGVPARTADRSCAMRRPRCASPPSRLRLAASAPAARHARRRTDGRATADGPRHTGAARCTTRADPAPWTSDRRAAGQGRPVRRAGARTGCAAGRRAGSDRQRRQRGGGDLSMRCRS